MSYYFMYDTWRVSHLLFVGLASFHPFSLSELMSFQKICTLNIIADVKLKKKLTVKKGVCLPISFKIIPYKKVSFYEVCPTQTLKKTGLNNSLVLSTYSVVNEESLYLFCS